MSEPGLNRQFADMNDTPSQAADSQHWNQNSADVGLQELFFPLAFFTEHMLQPITADRALCLSQAVWGSLFEGISAIC